MVKWEGVAFEDFVEVGRAAVGGARGVQKGDPKTRVKVGGRIGGMGFQGR